MGASPGGASCPCPALLKQVMLHICMWGQVQPAQLALRPRETTRPTLHAIIPHRLWSLSACLGACCVAMLAPTMIRGICSAVDRLGTVLVLQLSIPMYMCRLSLCCARTLNGHACYYCCIALPFLCQWSSPCAVRKRRSLSGAPVTGPTQCRLCAAVCLLLVRSTCCLFPSDRLCAAVFLWLV